MTSLCFSQEFSVSAKLSNIKTNGLHSVLLTPKIRSIGNDNLSDLRIYDSKNREVPYFLTNDFQTTSTAFEEFKILSKNSSPGKSSSVIFENQTAKNLNGFTLAIANSDVSKTYNVSGSADLKQWFGLVNNAELYDLSDNQSTFIYKNISVPTNLYRYIKVEFNDKKTLPVAILKAGNFSSLTTASKIQELKTEDYKIEEFTKEKKTRITFKFNAPQIIDQISFEIKNPSLYRRNATVLVNRTRTYKKRKKEYQENVAYFELTSNSKNTFTLPELRENEITIEVENQDNQPLSIGEVKLYQNPIHFVADLNAGENYTLKLGNPDLIAPQYDLSTFQNTISKVLPEAEISDIKVNFKKPAQHSSNSEIWNNPWVMWVCIGLGGLVIFYFSVSLMKDMKKN